MAHLCAEAHARFLGRRPGFPSSSPLPLQSAPTQFTPNWPRRSAAYSPARCGESHRCRRICPSVQEIHVVTMRGPIHMMMMMTRQTGQVQQQEAGLRQCKHTRCKKNPRLTLSANCQDKCSTWESLHPTMRVRLRERRKTVHLHKLMQNSPT